MYSTLFYPCSVSLDSLLYYSDDAKRAALCFRETLVISSKGSFTTDAVPVGGYCILVERIGVHDREFLVLVQSSMTVDDCFGGSSTTCSVTENLHCLLSFFTRECILLRVTYNTIFNYFTIW